MSTEDQNRAVVTVKKGVDVDALMQELTSLGNTTDYVPARRVEMYNEKNDSRRNFDVILTRQEAEKLKNDPRIVDVRYGSKLENGIIPRSFRIEGVKQYNKVASQNSNHYNWAIPACTNNTDPFGAGTFLNYTHSWNLDGTGVDVVIQDSGIDVAHPEWLNHNGTASRLQQINWPAAAGLSSTYTQFAGHYTDDDGHGTHVAGTAAGRLYGWARGADIYAIKIFDTDAFGISASFNLIRGWHNLKGNNNPTVVNMSWGYFAYYDGITGGNYRGTPWVGSSIQNIYGMLDSSYNFDGGSGLYYHPVRVSSVDADIEDCVNDGIILVAAAGNDAHKMDIFGGADYNNYFTNSFGNRYYHRGSTPNGPTGVVSVGSVRLATGERKAEYSTTGPGVQIYAPGDSIQSSIPVGSLIATSYGAVNYPTNSNFKAVKISGTSMAAPQVAGVLACLVGSRTQYNSNDCIQWLEKKGILNRMTEIGSGYTDYYSFQTGPNRYLRQPFTSQTPLHVSGMLSQTR